MGYDPTNTKEGSVESESNSPFEISQEPTVPGGTVPEFAPAPAVAEVVREFGAEPDASYEALGELPKTYETGSLFLAARDPHWLFVYWDIDLEAFDSGKLPGGMGVFYLKVFKGASELVDQIQVNNQARNWYFPIQEAGAAYHVELGFNDAAGKWAVIGTSNEVTAPADAFSTGLAEFATVPFHLSFQRMMDLVHQQMSSGDSLVGALSKLQNTGASSLKELATAWTEEQKRLLEALVGEELVAQISLGSAEIDQVFRQRLSTALSQKLSSEASSELSFLRGLAGSESLPGGASSLFSGAGASWSGVGGGSAAGFTGAEVGSSGSGGATAAAGLPGTTSWQSGIGGLGSLSVLAAMGSQVAGSWGGSSWSGSSGSVGNWGGESSWADALGSSWSAQPFRVNREPGIFMQVNAEVTFYGSTLPDASVWIDGKPVPLSADGSFRYHFRLPAGDFEIPIVAESANGEEIRSAKLSFKSGTVRTAAHVNQPSWLK